MNWCSMGSQYADSPGTTEKVRVTVRQERIEQSDPSDAVVTVVALDPKRHYVGSLEAVWGVFCHQVYFFASCEEAGQQDAGRAEIEILTAAETYALGKQSRNEISSYA